MRRRIILGLALSAMLLLMSATPALAGGWAVVTLDALPREVRAGQRLSLGFSVRQHGHELVNTDWNGRPLKPVLRARKQTSSRASSSLAVAAAQRQDEGQTLLIEARQAGPVGHFVAEIVFPSDGVWEWEISVPPFVVQGDRPGDAVVLAPLAVLPTDAANLQTPAAGLRPSPIALRWGGVLLLASAALIGLAARRELNARRQADQLG